MVIITITYVKGYNGKLDVPKLHDVVIRADEIFSRDEYNEMNEWCYKNCKERFYFFPSWTRKIGAQFEDDEDAMLFALRWK